MASTTASTAEVQNAAATAEVQNAAATKDEVQLDPAGICFSWMPSTVSAVKMELVGSTRLALVCFIQ